MPKSKTRKPVQKPKDHEVAAEARRLFQSGYQHHMANRLPEAEHAYRRVLASNPRHADSLGMLGFLAHQRGRDDQAVELMRKAIAVNPAFAPYHSNLAHALIELGRRDEARESFERAIQLDERFHEAQLGLAILLRENGVIDPSIERFRAVIAANPDNALAHVNLGYGLLLRGDLQDAWKEMEWRFQIPGAERLDLRFSKPRWDGELDGRPTLLIHAEQGLGDTIQFCRYASLAADRGVRVVFEVQRLLVRLLKNLHDDVVVVARGDPLTDFDFQIPLMSLPLVFDTTLDNVPTMSPYLRPDDDGVAVWKERVGLVEKSGSKVGFVWAGNPGHGVAHLAAVDRQRSIDFALLMPLLALDGISTFSLQKDSTPPEGAEMANLMPFVADMADTAALIANLDLVISVDTSVAHLAAALGKPVWLLDRFNHDWRWLAGRETSPWYPTMRIYRQTAFGDWTSAVARIADDLRLFTG